MSRIDPHVKHLLELYDEAKQARDIVSKERNWDKANDLIRGKQTVAGRPEYKPEAVLNMLRPLIERKASMLTDTKPRFTVQPTRSGEGRAKAAKLLDEVSNAWWDDQGIDMRLARGTVFAQAFGTLITQTRWSVTQKEAVLDIVDPRMFYVDPFVPSADELHNAEYVILEETPSLDWVKMRFPNTSATVRSWTPPGASDDTGGFVNRIAQRIRKPFSSQATSSAVSRALIRHYWVKDYTTEDIQVDKGGRVVDIRKRLFPGGRYIIWAHGEDGGTILHNEGNPYWDLIHPFDMLDWYIDLDGPWGDSEVCTHKSPQLLLNKLAEVMVENSMLMNNAIWICDKTAFPATESNEDGWGQLTNAPGAVIKKRPGTEVKREYPGGIPGSSMQLTQFLMQFLEHTGGTPEVMTKGKAGNVQSGIGLEQLQMSAGAMIRLKARALEALISRIGQKYISRVLQFYPDEHVLHVLGPGPEFREYVWIRNKLRDALGASVLKDAHRDFRFRVAPGSSLSLTKIQRGLMAVQLKQLGCVDRQAVLEAVEWPDWREVLKRTQTELMLGLEPGMQLGGKQKSGKRGPAERQAKIAGRI